MIALFSRRIDPLAFKIRNHEWSKFITKAATEKDVAERWRIFEEWRIGLMGKICMLLMVGII
jgi:hypothetical protein